MGLLSKAKNEPVVIVAAVVLCAVYVLHGFQTGDWTVDWLGGFVALLGTFIARALVSPTSSAAPEQVTSGTDNGAAN